MRIGFITGIKKEAEILRKGLNHPHTEIRCAGANPDRAYQLASQLAQQGCEALISFGIAGALDPALQPGDLILPKSVTDQTGGTFSADENILQRLAAILPESVDAPIYASQTIFSDPAKKNHLFQTYGTSAVDMESGGVAKAATEQGLPLLICRSIADTANQAVPRAVHDVMDANGNTRIGKVLLGLAAHPGELPGLLKLAKNSEKAFATLRRVAAIGFGF